MSDSDVRAILNDVRTVLDRLWTLKQGPSDAGKVMLRASGRGLLDPLTFFDTYWGRLFSTATSRCQRISASTGTNHELKRSLWPDSVTRYAQSPPTALCRSTVICGGRTSLSATGGLVGSFIGRIRSGFRAIGNFTRCATFGWHIQNAYVPCGRTLSSRQRRRLHSRHQRRCYITIQHKWLQFQNSITRKT